MDAITQAFQSAFPEAALLHSAPLQGGMSAQIVLLQAVIPPNPEPQKIVARIPSPQVQALFPDPAQHEFQVLQAVHAAKIPAPKPLAHTQNVLFLQYLEGRPTAAPDDPHDFIRQVALALAQIHQTPLTAELKKILPPTKPTFTPPPTPPDPELREPELRQAAARLVPADPGPSVLRHGDFWPGNLLWQNRRLTGIIDWENALAGPALADLAITRLDIRWILGPEAQAECTARYLEQNPLDLTHLPYWDLRAALRPIPTLPEWAAPYNSLNRPDITPQTLKTTLLEFIEEGLAKTNI